MSSKTYAPFAKPLYVMLKPIGAVCNLGCTYCYYLEKKELYPDKGNKTIMSDDLLERFVSQYIEAQTMQPILFTWHGGEPLMRDISFYKKALELQRKYAKGKQISNTLQTNGTLLNDEWCEFFRENNFLIGISIDGAKPFHDKYRTTKDLRSTFDHVLRGINLLKKHGVEYNIMGVVNDFNINHPLEFYQFFKDIDSHYIQFSSAVERDSNGNVTQWSVTPEKWGDFLIAVFNEWVRKDVGIYFVQYFDSALANWVGVDPGICIFAKNCGHAGVMEFNGDVYSCDHFVYPQYKLGNINDKTLIEMMYSVQQSEFGLAKSTSLSSQCKQCKYLFACRGECPKNRISKTQSGEEINYLCNGYYKFFEHIAPYMDFMKKELEAQRPPGNIMKVLK